MTLEQLRIFIAVAEREQLANELQEFLNAWWNEHILKSDLLFAKFVRAQGISLPV